MILGKKVIPTWVTCTFATSFFVCPSNVKKSTSNKWAVGSQLYLKWFLSQVMSKSFAKNFRTPYCRITVRRCFCLLIFISRFKIRKHKFFEHQRNGREEYPGSLLHLRSSLDNSWKLKSVNCWLEEVHLRCSKVSESASALDITNIIGHPSHVIGNTCFPD